MPATVPSRRKSSRARGGLEALENGAEGSSMEKENSAPTTAATATEAAPKKKKREADTAAIKKPTKVRTKVVVIVVAGSFEFWSALGSDAPPLLAGKDR
jgi:hypothetical protein